MHNNERELLDQSRYIPLSFDEDGFLTEQHYWGRGVSRMIAEMDGIGDLTSDHWNIIYYLREHRLSYGSLPPMSQVCRTYGLDKHAIPRLFGSCREAWRVAGLPHPGVEALTYMV